jgi:hypothetical protein
VVDHYDILGVARDATKEGSQGEGQQDEGPTAGELTDAKNALLDPVQRKELDEELDRELNARGEYGYGSMWQDVAGGVK